MKYILDTNVCINILKGSSINIKNKIADVDNEDISIPSIVRFELYYGAYKSIKQKEVLHTLKIFLNSFKTLTFDDNAALICGQIRAYLDKKGTPIGPYDLIIASIALSHNLILVTNNTKEFSRILNLKLEDWRIQV